MIQGDDRGVGSGNGTIDVHERLERVRRPRQSEPYPHAPAAPTGTPADVVRLDEPWLTRAATTPAEATALLECYAATLDDGLLRPTLEALADADHAKVVAMNRAGSHQLSMFNEALVLLHHAKLILDGEFAEVAKRVAAAKYPVTDSDPGAVPVAENLLSARTHGALRELECCYVPRRMLEVVVQGTAVIGASPAKTH